MKRNLLLLVFALAILWFGWYLYSSSEAEKLAVPQHMDFFVVDTLAVDSVEVKYADWTRLAKIGGEWIVYADGYTFPANTEQLTKLLNATNSLVLENMISRSPAKFKKFEVDTTRGRVMRFFSQGKPLAEFVIGKLGPGVSHTYVRRLDSDSVYLARGRFQQLYTLMPDMWKSSIIVDCDSSTIDTIRWVYPDHEIQLARATGEPWTVTSSRVVQPQPVDTAFVGRLLYLMCPLYTQTFLPDSSPEEVVFDKIGLQLIMTQSDGAADTIIWKDVPPNENRMTARYASQPKPIFLFARQRYEQIAPPYDSLVAREAPSDQL